MNHIKFIIQNYCIIRDLWKDKKGGSMIESGLLIALSLILFLMLISIVTNIYDWIEGKFNDVISFFNPT
ncbi:MAG: Flp family type IVb pilin [Promethearchaeota archaeon]